MTPRKIPVRGCASQQCALKFGVCAQGTTHFHHFSLSLPMSSFFHFWGPIWSNDFDIDRKTPVLYSVGSNAFDPHKNHIPNIITSIHTGSSIAMFAYRGPDWTRSVGLAQHESSSLPLLTQTQFSRCIPVSVHMSFQFDQPKCHAFWPFTMKDHVKPQ